MSGQDLENEEGACRQERFSAFFQTLCAGHQPYGWQRALSEETRCIDRIIQVPTGFGKTQGVLATWLWHRVYQQDQSWPHLVLIRP